MGVPVATAQWIGRRPKFVRTDREVAAKLDAPVAAGKGVGPGYHRLYSVRIRGAELEPSEIITAIGGDPNLASPAHVARFVTERGDDSVLAVGDEFGIELAGPWDGPVEVIGVESTSFRLRTRPGHAEAGEIEFRCRELGDDLFAFEIESWARSSDQLVGLLYDKVGLVREMQLNMWGHFLERVAELAGGSVDGDLEVLTDRHPDGVSAPGGDA